MNPLRSPCIASALALAFTAVPVRAAEESPFKFEFHGFVVASLYMQNQTFLFGQGSGLLIAAPRPSLQLPQPGVATSKSDTFVGGDVRQVRPIFVMYGPDAWGAKPKAHLEFDLFGNSNPRAFGYEAPNVRLRQAYAELKWGNTTLDAGQHSAQLILAQIPTSVAHMTNPVTFGAGLLGWRTISFRATHTLPMEGWKLELAGEISHGKWEDATAAGAAFPGNQPDQISFAWASSMPQLVGRVKADGQAGDLSWMGWLGGCYESIDVKGFGSSNNPDGVTLQDKSVKRSFGSYALVVGGRFAYAPVALKGQFYTGRATAPLTGSTLQFGDIGDIGYWAEVGVNLTSQISLWGIHGGSSVDEKDLQNWLGPRPPELPLAPADTTLRKGNQLLGGMLRFMDGGYAFAAEYYRYTTKYLLGNLAAPGGTSSSSAYQFLVSGGYFF